MPLEESLAQAMNRISSEVRGGPLSRMARGGRVDEATYGPDATDYRRERAQATSDAVNAALAKSSAAMEDASAQDGPVMRSYGPSWRDRIGAYLFDQTSGSPVSRRVVEGLVGSTGLGNTGLSVADVVPGGQLLAMQEAAKDGDYKGAAMNAMFLGPSARIADKMALAAAEKMAAKGADRAAILNETSWFKGPDSKWRFEIPDDAAKFDSHAATAKTPDRLELASAIFNDLGGRGFFAGNDQTTTKKALDMADEQIANRVAKGSEYQPIRDILSHNQLYEAYPKIATTPTAQEGRLGLNTYGTYDGENITYRGVRRIGEQDSSRSALLHELQHAVQNEEGFARGANTFGLKPGTPAWDIYQERLKAIRTPMTEAEFAASGAAHLEYPYSEYLKQTRAALKNNGPMLDRSAQDYAVQDAYRRHAGEVEARNVQKRMDMTPDERRATPPWLTQDVPDEQQIVRMGNYADGGPVYDPMGNVTMPPEEGFAPSPVYDRAMDAIAKAGAAVGSPVMRALQTAADVYSEKSREAAAENEALRQQAMQNMAGDRAGMVPVGAGQMLLSQLGTATLPLTAAAKTIGHAATQATGNPRFGENVELLSGFVDPSHVGMLKATAPMAGAAAVRQAVQTAREVTPVAQAARELSPLGLYSHGAETAGAFQQAKGTPEQYAAMLQKAGVKPVEMEGFNEAFAGRPSVTREELAKHFNERMPQVEEKVLRNNKLTEPEMEERGQLHWMQRTPEQEARYQELSNNTGSKFQQYTLPGGENYREVLLKLPERVDEAEAVYKQMRSMSDGVPNATISPEYKALQKQYDDLSRPMFRDPHWDDPNVVVHLRFTDRVGPNGEKILHMEEAQSGWGQKGRKEGFRNPDDNMQDLVKEYDYLTKQRRALEVSVRNGDDAAPATQAAVSRLTEVNNQMQALSDRMTAVRSNIPTAPYVTNTQAWTDLALKRALKEAAEGGYDKLVWTPGAEQAKRYDLSKQVSNIEYFPESNRFRSFDNNGHGAMDQIVPPEKLADYVGKEVADRLLNKPTKVYETGSGRKVHSLEGVDLSLGGEGMKGYYDKIVPKRLQEIIKKHDPSAKVGMGRLPVEGRNKGSEDIARELGMSIQEINALPDAEKRALIGSVRNTISAPSLTITPKMRESILRGQPHMAEGGAVPAKEPMSKEETLKLAAEHGLHRPQIANILRQNDPRLSPVQATARAREIMAGDTAALHGILSDSLMADLRRMLKGAAQ